MQSRTYRSIMRIHGRFRGLDSGFAPRPEQAQEISSCMMPCFSMKGISHVYLRGIVLSRVLFRHPMVPTGLSPGAFFLTGYIFFSPITRIALLVLIVTTCGSALCAWLPAYKSFLPVRTIPVLRYRECLCIPRHTSAVTLSVFRVTMSALSAGDQLSLFNRDRNRVLHSWDKHPSGWQFHMCAAMSHCESGIPLWLDFSYISTYIIS